MEDSYQKIINALPKRRKIKYLVHNAGFFQPLGQLSNLTRENWRQHFATNFNAPLFITKELLSWFDVNAKILHVSSGTAHRPMPGWIGYCASKAALYMAHEF